MSEATRIRNQIERFSRSVVSNNRNAAACSTETEAGRNSAKYFRAMALIAAERLEALQGELAKIEAPADESQPD